MLKSIPLAGLILLVVTGCASPESRVRSSLVNFGLPYAAAECLAENAAPRLSSRQIKELSRLSGLSERRIGDMKVDELTELLARSGNLEMVEIFARAGISCAIMG